MRCLPNSPILAFVCIGRLPFRRNRLHFSAVAPNQRMICQLCGGNVSSVVRFCFHRLLFVGGLHEQCGRCDADCYYCGHCYRYRHNFADAITGSGKKQRRSTEYSTDFTESPSTRPPVPTATPCAAAAPQPTPTRSCCARQPMSPVGARNLYGQSCPMIPTLDRRAFICKGFPAFRLIWCVQSRLNSADIIFRHVTEGHDYASGSAIFWQVTA